MFGFCPLASGSKGNALYLGSKSAKILIDAGITTKMLQKRLDEIGVSLKEIDAIIITHEHMDHIKALKVLTNRFSIPIFTNRLTAKGIYQNLSITPRYKIFSTAETFFYKDLKIHPFSVQHDTLDPVGLRIEMDNITLGICTDLGYATSVVKNSLMNCDYLYLEANHEPSMVHASSRSPIYKERVLSKQGHLSNEDSAKLLSWIHHSGLKTVYLAHLSSECNAKEKALEVVSKHLEEKKQKVKLLIAHQEECSKPVFF